MGASVYESTMFITAFAGLILYGMITVVVVLVDLRHTPVAPPAPLIVTGETAQGVPWVAGT